MTDQEQVLDEPETDPEQALAAMRKVLGDDELELDDFESWRKDNKGWASNHNSRIERLADKEKALDEKIDKLSKTPPPAQPARAAQPQASAAELKASFFEALGYDSSNPDTIVEVTPDQLFRVFNNLNAQIKTSRTQFIKLLGDNGIVGIDENGVLRPDVDIHAELAEIKEIAVTTRDQYYDAVTENFLDKVQKKHPDIDRKQLQRVIQKSTSDDVESEVWDAAKEQQDGFDSKVSKKVAKEGTRRKAGRSTATMAGRGAPTTGKKPPNPLLSREGLKQALQRAREKTEREAAV